MENPASSSILQKCALVLDILAHSKKPLGFSEIVKRTGFVKSSAHRILSVLLGEELVEHDEDSRTYRLGRRPQRWAHASLNRRDLPQISDNRIEGLAERTGMNGILSVLDDDSVLYLRTYDTFPVKFASIAGERAPLFCTAAGKIFLAHLPKQRRDDLLGRLKIEQFTEFTITDIPALERELKQVSANGYALALQEEVFQVMGIAAPIRKHDGRVVATVSLWTLTERTNREKMEALAEPLVSVAEEISATLKLDQAP